MCLLCMLQVWSRSVVGRCHWPSFRMGRQALPLEEPTSPERGDSSIDSTLWWAGSWVAGRRAWAPLRADRVRRAAVAVRHRRRSCRQRRLRGGARSSCQEPRRAALTQFSDGVGGRVGWVRAAAEPQPNRRRAAAETASTRDSASFVCLFLLSVSTAASRMSSFGHESAPDPSTLRPSTQRFVMCSAICVLFFY